MSLKDSSISRGFPLPTAQAFFIASSGRSPTSRTAAANVRASLSEKGGRTIRCAIGAVSSEGASRETTITFSRLLSSIRRRWPIRARDSSSIHCALSMIHTLSRCRRASSMISRMIFHITERRISGSRAGSPSPGADRLRRRNSNGAKGTMSGSFTASTDTNISRAVASLPVSRSCRISMRNF